MGCVYTKHLLSAWEEICLHKFYLFPQPNNREKDCNSGDSFSEKETSWEMTFSKCFLSPLVLPWINTVLPAVGPLVSHLLFPEHHRVIPEGEWVVPDTGWPPIKSCGHETTSEVSACSRHPLWTPTPWPMLPPPPCGCWGGELPPGQVSSPQGVCFFSFSLGLVPYSPSTLS